MSTRSRRTRSLLSAGAVALALTTGLAACGGDDDSSATTTTAADASTTSTTTTLPDELPTVAELWAEPVAESGPGVAAKVYATIQGGASDDTLIGVKVEPDLAAGAALVPQPAVELPATTTVNLDEDSTYIELTGLATPLEENRPFELTLEFESAPAQTVQGAVRNPADPEATN
jgi:copper(I)-binding protein